MPDVDPNAVHDYEIFVRTTPEALWDAITSGEQTRRFFHGTRIESEWRVGAAVVYHSGHAGRTAVDREVRAVEPPRPALLRLDRPLRPRARAGEAPLSAPQLGNG